MKIKLSQPVAPNSAAASYDVLQLKKALNRIGLYTPPDTIGITDIPDTALFDGIKQFQQIINMPATGTIKPEDDTSILLNSHISKIPEGDYIWRTVEDGKVRQEHAQYNRTVRSWDDGPDPGDDFGCRCWAEKIESGLNPVYPELLIPLAKIGRLFKLWEAWYSTRNSDWTLGKFKSDTKWGNQLKKRDWTPDQITETLKYGKKFPAPNKVNPQNTATRYEYKGRYVTRDEKTKEILQISKPDFKRPQIEATK